MKKFIIAMLLVMTFASDVHAKTVHVRSYRRKDGTVVRSHTRNIRGSSSGGYAPSGRSYTPSGRSSSSGYRIGRPVAGCDSNAVIYSSWGAVASGTNLCLTSSALPNARSDDEQYFDACHAIYDNDERCGCWIPKGSFYCERHNDFDVTNRPHKAFCNISKKDADKIATTKEKIEKMRKCIDYYSDKRDGELPENVSTLQAMNPAFLAPPVKDAWGRSFSFSDNSEGLDVRSAGADGKFGNEDDIVLIMEK